MHNHTHHVGTTQVYYCQQSTFKTRCGPTNIATYRAAIAAKNTEKNAISENKKSYKKGYQSM